MPDHPDTAAVVLAAGGSRRLGAAKQLLRWHGSSLVRRAVEAALGSRCQPVYVVVGSGAGEVAAELSDTDAVIVDNPAWREGLSSSIAAGVRAATGEAGPAALLLMLVDQPHVSAEVLDGLLAAFDGGIAASRYAGTLGVPAVFGRAHFEALIRLSGDRGARPLLEAEGERVRAVDFEAGAVDIDTLEDWSALAAFAVEEPD
ncbi:MAG: nucleotidyltransferase family protein [Myxococcota bacterium]